MNNDYLKVTAAEMSIFDPQLYRRLLAEVIDTAKDSRLVLFVLAFPTHQLTTFNSKEYLK